MTVDPDYFEQCLEGDHPWCHEVLKKMETKRPFAARETSETITPRMQHLVQSLEIDAGAGPMRKLRFQSKVLELLALQIEQFSIPHKNESIGLNNVDQQKLYDLKKYLDQHFQEDLSLTRLGRICCLNEFKIKKGFKQLFGETVMGYVRKLRMEHAARLLLDTTLSIEEISMELQYQHAHHFSTAFKEYTGYLPSTYRTASPRFKDGMK
jgi:AraC-like DNA-binding protein